MVFDYFLSNRYSILPTIESYNFGKIEFNWGMSKEESKIYVNIIDIEDITRVRLSLSYIDLKFNKNYLNNTDCYESINSRFKTLSEFFKYYKENKFHLIFLVLNLGVIIGTFCVIFLFFFVLYRLIKRLILFFTKLIFKNKNELNNQENNSNDLTMNKKQN